MKKLGLALALTVLGATAASAQPTIQFRLGDNDRNWDRGRERVIVRDRDDWRDRRDDWRGRRSYRRDIVSTGSVDCRTTVVYKTNDFGRRVKTTIRRCD
jgi:hypothetical protein